MGVKRPALGIDARPLEIHFQRFLPEYYGQHCTSATHRLQVELSFNNSTNESRLSSL